MVMTQEERWQKRYNELKVFIETNKRNPSKYDGQERVLVNWTKQQRKLMNAGEMKEPRMNLFKELLGLCEKYKHINQYK
jgi:hypothetical protein